MKKIILGIFVIGLMAIVAVPAFAKATKVDVCHVEGNGSYHMINISENALQAHLNHGDGLPGDVVGNMILGEDCSLEPKPILVVSSVMNFSNEGWGGWSCPAGTTVVEGGVSKTNTMPWVNADYPVNQVMAVPGATLDGFTFPVFPHWTYNTYPGETGWAVHNAGTAQNLYVYVYCAE